MSTLIWNIQKRKGLLDFYSTNLDNNKEKIDIDQCKQLAIRKASWMFVYVNMVSASSEYVAHNFKYFKNFFSF